MQNKSHAVMAQRTEAKDSLDDFPTPPWATRALLEHALKGHRFSDVDCLEPACGIGHMAKVLNEYFQMVEASDVHAYGYGDVRDFLKHPYEVNSFDWVITNPPFRLAEDFVLKSLGVARTGVAILARTVFLESVGRYNRLFTVNPPSIVAQFTERVPMLKGRLDRNGSTATGYCWLVWEKKARSEPRLVWIPPCRRSLEKDDDYASPPKSLVPSPTVAIAQKRRRIVPARSGDLFG